MAPLLRSPFCRAAVCALSLLAGCGKSASSPEAQKARDACIAECQKRLQNKEDLSKGPCLSDSLPSRVIEPDWVCDVAHSPRQDVDNQSANQCAAYHDGTAGHFIEVDPACAFIQAN